MVHFKDIRKIQEVIFMKLREIRLKKGLTVPKLSELSDVPVRTIENTEKRDTCNVSTAIKLAHALNVSLDELCNYKL